VSTTELTQREKFESWWERAYHNGNPPRFGWERWRDGEGYEIDDDEPELDGMWNAWQAASTELVEALESAQKSNAFLKDQLSELANFNPDWDKLEASYESWREIAAELLAAKGRIAELEARTVTLPDVEKWRPVKEVVGQYSYRALVIKSLAAAGIKCEVKGE